MSKSKKNLSATPKNPDAVTIHIKPGDDTRTSIAQTYLRPTVQAASTVRAFNKAKDSSGPDLMALIDELGRQVQAANDGDLRRAEAMLIAQAHALDAIFGTLARRAAAQDYLPQFQAFLQLALKAQAQSRATLQTLVEVKYPRQTQFVRQQNVAVNQQVNNGNDSRARAIESEQSKLLEAKDGERLDTAATSAASSADPHLATVGQVNRAANGTREI